MKKILIFLFLFSLIPVAVNADLLTTYPNASPTYGFFTLTTTGTAYFGYPYDESGTPDSCIFSVFKGVYPNTSTPAGGSTGSQDCGTLGMSMRFMNGYAEALGTGSYWAAMINPYTEPEETNLVYYSPMVNLASGSWTYVYSLYSPTYGATTSSVLTMPNWGLWNWARDLFIWALYPSQENIDENLTILGDLAETKVPFAYFYALQDEFESLDISTSTLPYWEMQMPSALGTGTFKIVDLDATKDLIGDTVWNVLQSILVFALWAGLAWGIWGQLTRGNTTKL